ncbi:MAG TPA: hypothetical protein VNL71_11380 [Chloroflexota bacterium]|nr:hypothetical protein [Chloroflexota bacterium]
MAWTRASPADDGRRARLQGGGWVQARVAGSGTQTTAAYRRGRTEGRKEGEVDGHQRGRAEGEQVAGIAGFRAGLLASAFAADQGRHYDASTVARRLLGPPDQRAVAERLIPTDYQPDWARLLRAVEQGRVPAAIR